MSPFLTYFSPILRLKVWSLATALSHAKKVKHPPIMQNLR
ncbi:hypothetical protein GAGA_1762 [Paraglaciecola agarilytica NO2]|uniref:Uncharacterized protein n=1 Tax=Paraglaciecola agarilytica NO2 TaxID=1125747 RepID=A0ABQ0I5P6_9ALTE|nr:hypothetical protein GAGA_1762 [Paraglaciecola agarilytica NO2]